MIPASVCHVASCGFTVKTWLKDQGLVETLGDPRNIKWGPSSTLGLDAAFTKLVWLLASFLVYLLGWDLACLSAAEDVKILDVVDIMLM